MEMAGIENCFWEQFLALVDPEIKESSSFFRYAFNPISQTRRETCNMPKNKYFL